MVSRSLVFLLLSLPLLGCVSHVYELKMRPDGDTLHREITCYKFQSQNVNSGKPVTFEERRGNLMLISQDVLDRAAAAYDRPAPEAGPEQYVFEGAFTLLTPDDIGGAGRYVHYDSPMGALTAYVERFQGEDDLAGGLQRALAGTDRLKDHLVRWLSLNLNEEPAWPALKRLIEGKLCGDAKNLLVLLWFMTDATKDLNPQERQEQRYSDVIARTTLFLSERGYLPCDKIPWLVRVLSTGEWKEKERASLLKLIQETFFQKLGTPSSPEDYEALWDFFLSEDLEDSFERYIQGTEEWEDLLRKWEAEKETDPEAKPPETDDVIQQLFYDIFPFVLPVLNMPTEWIYGDVSDLLITLSCPVEPDRTNGAWDGEKKEIAWSGRTCRRKTPPPLAYAYWVEPAEAYQSKLFGKVLLKGMDLAAYALWYSGLKEAEAQEWNAFMDGLAPGEDLIMKIGSKQTLGDSAPLIQTPRELLIKALKGPSKPRKGG